MQVQILTFACRLSAKPTFQGITSAKPQSRHLQGIAPSTSFHHIARRSLTVPATKLGITGMAASTLNLGFRNYAKHSQEGDRLNPVLEGRPVMLDPAQSYAYSEAKLIEMKKKLKQKGLMKDPPKKPPIM